MFLKNHNFENGNFENDARQQILEIGLRIKPWKSRIWDQDLRNKTCDGTFAFQIN